MRSVLELLLLVSIHDNSTFGAGTSGRETSPSLPITVEALESGVAQMLVMRL
jgi:hypothetical protein